MVEKLLQVRCPACNKLAGEVSERSRVRIKCSRCGEVFGGKVVGREPPGAQTSPSVAPSQVRQPSSLGSSATRPWAMV